ncbi:hypothetical protein C1708_30125 [Streptomyces sp. DH-12]|nr:hypothetical protein C1708_30125 [Streptomyces sp. DH-12]
MLVHRPPRTAVRGAGSQRRPGTRPGGGHTRRRRPTGPPFRSRPRHGSKLCTSGLVCVSRRCPPCGSAGLTCAQVRPNRPVHSPARSGCSRSPTARWARTTS